MEYLGNEELLHVTVQGQEIVAIVDSAHNVRPDDMVQLRLPVDKLHLFNLETGARPRQRRRPAGPLVHPTAGRPHAAGRPSSLSRDP